MESPPQPPPSAAEYLRLVGIAALIGIPAALAAALFLGLIHELEHWLWDELPASLGYAAPPWFFVLGLPVLGALLVVLARAFLPGDGGHRPLEGISATPTPPSYVPGVVLAAVGTLAFGAVLGPEMPVVALGSAVGVVAHRVVRLGGQEGVVLSTAGQFSAISALFGGPIVAGMLLVESGLSAGSRLIPALLPGLVAAAIGYVIFVGFGSWGGLEAPGLIVPNLPPYEGLHPGDLSMAIVTGVASVLVLTGIRRLAVHIDGLQGRFGMPALLLAGGFVVGALALAAQALGADSQDVLFSGQASIGVAVDATSISILVILLVAKGLAYAVSLGSGFRGGPIFPAIFIGVALASLPVAAFGTSPTLAVAVGAAAGMAAQTRLLLSPLLLALLLVGPTATDTIPAAVLASASAWIGATALQRRAEGTRADRSVA